MSMSPGGSHYWSSHNKVAWQTPRVPSTTPAAKVPPALGDSPLPKPYNTTCEKIYMSGSPSAAGPPQATAPKRSFGTPTSKATALSADDNTKVKRARDLERKGFYKKALATYKSLKTHEINGESVSHKIVELEVRSAKSPLPEPRSSPDPCRQGHDSIDRREWRMAPSRSVSFFARYTNAGPLVQCCGPEVYLGGYRLPSTMWKQLFPHQRDGVKWMWKLNADEDMGGAHGVS